MATKSNKEIRVLPVKLETRKAAGNGQRSIAGSILYNEESQVMRDFWGDEFVEELATGCFADSLKTRGVVGLWSHDISQVLGNTKSGTLRLDDGEERLDFDLDLPDTQAGNDAWTSVKRGDVDGMSFGMIVRKDKWSKQGDVYKRTILDAELYEISPVAFPAYPVNEVSCRSLQDYKKGLEKNMGNENKEIKEVGKVKEVKEAPETREAAPAVAPPLVTIPVDNRQEQRAAFNHYLRTGEIRDGGTGNGNGTAAGPIMVSGSGGALAPDDFAREIIDGLHDEVVMRQLARILPAISGKSAVYPRRTGGSGAAMVEEGDPIVPYDLTFDQVVLVPKKAAAIVEVSNELLQDAGVDLAGYLSRHFIEEIGELLETQYWLGDATGANLQGILTANDGATSPALLIDRVPTADTTLAVEDIFALWQALPARYRKNATFVCNSALEEVLRGLQDGNGQYLMVRDLTSPMAFTLLGRPLVIANEFPGTLAAGTDALMVGDFSRAVYIADKRGIDIQRNDAVGFYSDVTVFRVVFRTDVALPLPEALKILAIKSGT